MNKFIQINERDVQRIISIDDICSATKSGDMLSIFLVNSDQPCFFRGEAAARLWRILKDSSLLIYDETAHKNAEALFNQDSSELIS